MAATGAGLVVAIEQVTGDASLSRFESGLAITLPVSVYLLMVWILHAPAKPPSAFRSYATPIAIVLILASTATPQPVLAAGVVTAALVGVAQWVRHSRAYGWADPI